MYYAPHVSPPPPRSYANVVTLHSRQDKSVNFVVPVQDGGYFEARFVQRSPTYFIVYLSSFSGCNKVCRFCHLTATKQWTQTAATMADFIQQATLVFQHYGKIRNANNQTETTVHFNFMARGEPLSNPVIVHQSNLLFNTLAGVASAYGLQSKFKVSSIIPHDFKGDLADMFSDTRSQLYYSLYSMDTNFRSKWLPNAMDPEDALHLIRMMQNLTGNIVTIHWAFIRDENDSKDDIDAILQAVERHNINFKFNLVRYNPYSSEYGQESDRPLIDVLFRYFTKRAAEIVPNFQSKIVDRVGFDVQASCGMFVEK